MEPSKDNQSLNCLIEGQNKLITTYQQDINPYLKDSNAYGNIYFARYFEWQGMCRELWFSEHIFPNMFELNGAFVTKFAHNDYEMEVLPFQKIRCLLNTRHVKLASFELIFRFYNIETGLLASKGCQKVAFMNTEGKKLIKLPVDILEKIRCYEIQ